MIWIVLTVIFAVLKLVGIVAWPRLWVVAPAGHACPRLPLLSSDCARNSSRGLHRRTDAPISSPPVCRSRARADGGLRLVDRAVAAHLPRDLHDLPRRRVDLRMHLTSPARAGCAVADEDDIQYVLIQHRQIYEPEEQPWSGLFDQYGNAMVHQH